MIRKAIPSDIDQIWQIHSSYILDTTQTGDPTYTTTVQKQGFLLDLETKNEFGSRITNDTSFFVWDESNVVLGFIDINKEIYFPQEADNIIWMEEGLKENYFNDPRSTVLHTIAVKSDQKEKGIASRLLIHTIRELKKQDYQKIFSIVVFGSVTNCPSLLFHSRHGFRRACVSMPMDLLGIKNYQSLLFVKDL